MSRPGMAKAAQAALVLLGAAAIAFGGVRLVIDEYVKPFGPSAATGTSGNRTPIAILGGCVLLGIALIWTFAAERRH